MKRYDYSTEADDLDIAAELDIMTVKERNRRVGNPENPPKRLCCADRPVHGSTPPAAGAAGFCRDDRLCPGNLQ